MRRIPLIIALTMIPLASSSCFDGVQRLNSNNFDGGVSRYANWGWFLPGDGTTHGQADVDRAFGQPDGVMLHLGMGGVLTVTFSDNLIYDQPGAEFTIHGLFESGETVTVFGSQDGAAYTVIGTVDGADPTVDITRGGFAKVVYLQIQDSGSGDGVEIDAVEVLPAP